MCVNKVKSLSGWEFEVVLGKSLKFKHFQVKEYDPLDNDLGKARYKDYTKLEIKATTTSKHIDV